MKYATKVYINGEELEHLVIPEGITNIPEYAFSCCNTITSLIIGNDVKILNMLLFLTVKIYRQLFLEKMFRL